MDMKHENIKLNIKESNETKEWKTKGMVNKWNGKQTVMAKNK